MMQALGIHHVAINVKNTDEAIEFYTTKLGFTVRDDRPDFGFAGAWLNVGPQQLHLLEVPVPDAIGQHFALHVDDIDAVIAELRAEGITVTDPIPVGDSGQRQAFLNDPSGNQIELNQPS
jgi:glyoxylase I family protein